MPQVLGWRSWDHYTSCVLNKGTQPMANGDRHPTILLAKLVNLEKGMFFLLVLPESVPFSYWFSQEGGPFPLVALEMAPFAIGAPREDTLFCLAQRPLMHWKWP